MKTHSLVQVCPGCGNKNSLASGGEGHPEEGDMMVCVYCASVWVFGESVALSKEDIEDLKAELPEFSIMMRMLEIHIASRTKH